MSGENLTLSDLKAEKQVPTLKTVSIADMPKIEKEDPKEAALKNELNDIDAALYETKKYLKEGFDEARIGMIEAKIENGEDPSDLTFTTPQVVVEKPQAVLDKEALYEEKRQFEEAVVEQSKNVNEEDAITKALAQYQAAIDKEAKEKGVLMEEKEEVKTTVPIQEEKKEEPVKAQVPETPRVTLSQLPIIDETPAIVEDTKKAGAILENSEDSLKEAFKMEIDEDDFEEDEKKQEEENNKQILEALKEEITSKVLTSKPRPDLTNFTVRNKPISVAKVLYQEQANIHKGDWVLLNAGRPFTISELGGSEIEALDVRGMRNRLNSYKMMYQTIYNHIIDPNKPEGVEAWLKTLSFYDIPHLIFGLYKATFETTNYIPYVCPHCKHSFLKSVEIMDMVKFDDDKFKDLFFNIYNKETVAPLTYETSVIPVSENYAFSLRMPSVYNIIFENAALEDSFTEKYAQVLGLIAYIDNIYFIDKANNDLLPIQTNPEPDNLTKTVKNKVKAYHNIVKKLSSDDFTYLSSEINKINEIGNKGITYQIPEVVCPKKECGKPIDATPKDPLQMVFLRHQLTVIART